MEGKNEILPQVAASMSLLFHTAKILAHKPQIIKKKIFSTCIRLNITLRKPKFLHFYKIPLTKAEDCIHPT